MTLRLPASSCSRSTFCVMSPTSTPASSSRASARWPAFGCVRCTCCQPTWLRAQ
ncbi:Uncharacterised protein [Mycobacteroides abscessus]|nr:Uncharacterised protein [Mycobacteroides abscessus]